MSILSKKLYIKKGSSTAACNIYSTAAEAGGKALRVGNGYVALKPIADTNATAGRVSVGGVTYAIATKHESGGGTTVPYTEKSWTTAGSYSFTVPNGITRVRVAVCGGGAGQGAFSAGGNGGDTSAFGVVATGGEGGNYGGSGGYDSQYVAVTAGQSYTITVGGAGGNGGTGGFVLIGYGGDI